MTKKSNTAPVAQTEITDADLQALAGELVAREAAEAQTPAVTEIPATAGAEESFQALMGMIGDEERAQVVERIKDAIEVRRSYETAKNPNNGSMENTLKNIGQKFPRASIAAALVVAGAAPEVMSRSSREGSMMNVYAVQKMVDVLDGLANGHMANAINLAVMRSLFACKKAGYAFTTTVAQAAASDKVKIDKAIGGVLTRHTVSSATAPTQASSTMSALETLGVVKRTGATRAAVWELTETPQTERLRELLAA